MPPPRGTPKYVADLPFTQRKELCAVLDMNAKWKELASELGFSAIAIYQFESAVCRLAGYNSSSDDLITEYCHRNPTIDELYVTLKRLNLLNAADKIREYVSKPLQQAGDVKNMRNPNEGIDDESKGLPKPSQQQSIQLKTPQSRNIRGGSAFGYSKDPFSDSDNNISDGQGGITPPYNINNNNKADNHTPQPSPGFQYPSPGVGIGGQQHQQQHLAVYNPGRMQINYTPPQQNNGYGYENAVFQGAKNSDDLGASNPMFLPPRQIHQLNEFQIRPSVVQNLQPVNLPPQQQQEQQPISGQFYQPSYPGQGYMNGSSGGPRFMRQTNASQSLELNITAIKRATYGFDKRNFVSEDRFGVVYKGKLGDQTLAVKQMKKIVDEKSGFDITTHLSKEVDVLKRCSHSNIIRLLHFINANEGEGHVFMIYPYMDHGTLRKNLAAKENQSPLKWFYRVKILMQSASGLAYLHNSLAEKPYVHGDISSENILLDVNMTAKLTGFGLAQAASGGGTDFGQRTHVSQSYLKNTLFGAEEYMPPEFKDVMPQLSTKGDVFAFGVVILETCTGLPGYDERREGGRLLWEYIMQLGDDPSATVLDSLNDRRQPMPSSIWEQVFKLGKKCISLKKKNRPTAQEVLQALDEIFEDSKRSGGGRKNSYASDNQQICPYRASQPQNAPTQKQPVSKPINFASNSITAIKRQNQESVGRQFHQHPHCSIVKPSFDNDCSKLDQSVPQIRYPEENTTKCTSIETTEIIFERPGNTVEIPMFAAVANVTDPNAPINPNGHVGQHLNVCYERNPSSDIYSGSNRTSDYDYVQRDISILTGSTASTSARNANRNNEIDSFSGVSSDVSKPVTSESSLAFSSTDVSSSITDVTSTSDISPQISTSDIKEPSGFDHIKNDLDILSDGLSASSSSSECRQQAGLSSPRKSSQSASGPKSAPSDPCSFNESSEKCQQDSFHSPLSSSNSASKGYSSSEMADLQVIGLGSDLAALDVNGPNTGNYSGMTSDASFDILHPSSLKGIGKMHPSASTPNEQHDVYSGEKTPPNNKKMFVLDDTVEVNPSVVFFEENRRYTSDTSGNSAIVSNSYALNTIGDQDFNFNLTPGDNTADNTSQCGVFTDNLARLTNKANDCQFFEDDEDEEDDQGFNDLDDESDFQSDFSQRRI